MKAEYIDHMGDDLRVVNAARVSFDKESKWGELYWDETPKALLEKDEKLLSYLANHNHWTPFSHCTITLRETVPIFVARQRFKHVIGFSYNEVSRRYVDEPPEFFIPSVWRGKSTSGAKQGSSDEEITHLEGEHIVWDDPSSPRTQIPIQEYYKVVLESCEELYKDLIKGGIAPEQARMVLPQSMYTSYYVTGSLAAWARAYKLRIDPHAQKEIRDLAIQWNEIIQPLFPTSWKALTNYA